MSITTKYFVYLLELTSHQGVNFHNIDEKKQFIIILKLF